MGESAHWQETERAVKFSTKIRVFFKNRNSEFYFRDKCATQAWNLLLVKYRPFNKLLFGLGMEFNPHSSAVTWLF